MDKTPAQLAAQVRRWPPDKRVELLRRLLAEDGIYGAHEAAGELQIAQQNLRPIPGLPEPLVHLKRGAIYLGEEIREFAKEYRERYPVSSDSR